MYYNYKNVKILINGSDIAVKNASLRESNSLSPVYLVGDRYTENYSPEDGIAGSLRLSYYLTGSDPFTPYFNNETSLISGNFGGLYFTSGYLVNYSINGAPNSIPDISADIVFFDDLKGIFASQTNTAPALKILNFADVSVSDPTIGAYGTVSNVSNYSYSFSSEVEPKYFVGDSVPYAIHFGERQTEISFETDNLTGLLPYSGKNAGLQINFNHPELPSLSQVFKVNGVLTARNFEIGAGDMLKSVITVKENNFDTPPVITSFLPTSGAPNSYVLINGSNFTNAINFGVGNIYGTIVSISDTQISGLIPLDAYSGLLSVTNFGGQTYSSGFNVLQNPLGISGVTPITGAYLQDVTITGSNFYKISSITLGNVTGIFNVISSNIIHFTVPRSGAWNLITVNSIDRGISGVSPQRFVPVPEISGFIPSSGTYNSAITITGMGFFGVTGVYFNNILAPSAVVVSNFSITGLVPSGYAQGYVTLYGQSGVFERSPTEFDFYLGVTGLSILSGKGNDLITVQTLPIPDSTLYPRPSSKFLVTFNGASGDFGLLADRISLTGIVPTGATTGPVVIYDTLKEPYPLTQTFRMLNGTPSLTYASPTSGKSGDSISIYGTNLYDITGVRISGGNPTNVSGITPVPTGGPLGDFFSFSLPNVTGGLYSVLVNAVGGNATGTNFFTVLEPLFLSGFSPISGGIGSLINITGRNIYPYSKIYFGSTGVQGNFVSTGFSANYNSGIAVVPPTSLSGNVALIIDNNVSSGNAGNYFIVQAPVISGFTPTSGDFGANISASGKYFSNITSLKIGTVSVSTYATVGTTGLNFTIPNGAVTDYVYGINSFNSGASPYVLTVNTPLITFSGFSPLSGFYGTQLTLSGSYLNTVTGIAFTGNGVELAYGSNTFTGVGTTGIKVSIPNGILDGKIRLYNLRGNYLSSNSLLINATPTIGSISPLFGISGDTVMISGVNLVNNSIFFRSPVPGIYASSTISSYVGSTGAYVTVPNEIVSGQLLISGNGTRYGFSTQFFIPLATISGFSVNPITTGSALTITGVNSYEVSERAIISGNDGDFHYIYSSSNKIDYTGTNPATGYTKVTGLVDDDFGGSGRVFLIPEGYESTPLTSLLTSAIGSYIPRMLSSSYLTINQSAPTISSFSPLRGNHTNLVTVSGASLGSVTGVTILGLTGQLVSETNPSVTFYPNTGTPGTSGQVVLYSPFGNVTSSAYFRYIAPLYVSGFTPTQGIAGTSVRISGSGLWDATGLFFGDNSATFVTGLHLGGQVISGTVPSVPEALPYAFTIKAINEIGQSLSASQYTILEGGKVFNGNVTISGNLHALGGKYYKVLRTSTNYTLTASDSVILVDTNTGDVQITLPDAATVSGIKYTIKNISVGINDVVIANQPSQFIDSGANYLLTGAWGKLNLISDGTVNYWTI